MCVCIYIYIYIYGTAGKAYGLLGVLYIGVLVIEVMLFYVGAPSESRPGLKKPVYYYFI